MICGQCRNCPEFQGDISLSMTSYGGHLSFFIVGMRSGMRCLFVTDLRGLWEIVPADRRIEWHCMKGHRQFEMLKSHIVEIAEPDDDCPFKAEVLMESWNATKEVAK